MSRRSNQKRRKLRRKRKLALEQAKNEFHQKYPEKGYYRPLFIINMYAQMYGREYAQQMYDENRDPLKFDNILMRKKRKLYDYYFSHNRWKEGIDALNTPGWEGNQHLGYKSLGKLESKALVNVLGSD